MAYNLLPSDRDQSYLMPPSLREWLPEGDLAWSVLDAVEQMDLGEFYARYRADGWGAAAYNPTMMVGLLLYAYCRGVRSSRQIAQALERDVAFRVVAANRQPDFRTLCRFRAEHQAALERLFVQVLRLCWKAGLVKLGVVALDGTKVAANAALAANRTHRALEEEVQRMLEDAKQTDAAEDARYGTDRRGDEPPEGLGRRKERLERFRQAKERLEREAAAEAEAARARQKQREAEEAATGKKRGRKPKPVAPEPSPEAKANPTDPDSRIMKTRQGYVQGYNVQAAVSEDQVILAVSVTQEANDVRQLVPMLEQVNATLAAAGIVPRPAAALADAGYWSEANLLACRRLDLPEVLVATTKDWKQRKALRERGCPRGRIPKGLSEKDRMERKLLTKRGRALYTLRSQTVEPVFGQMKDVQGFRRCLRRGKAAAEGEAVLVGTCHNLLKLWRRQRLWARWAAMQRN
jgi:transposase